MNADNLNKKNDSRENDPQVVSEQQLVDILLFEKRAGTIADCDKARLDKLLAKRDAGENSHSIGQLGDLLDEMPDFEPPVDLTAKTLARVEAQKRTQELSQKISLAELQRSAGAPRSTFSLKELVSIAAIFVVAVGIIISSFSQASHKNMQNKCYANTGQIGSALLSYASDNRGFLPAANLSGKNWLTGGSRREIASNSSNLYKLISEKYVPSPRVFQCPAVGSENFVPRENATDFQKSDHINYSFQHNIAGPALSVRQSKAVASKMVVLSDANPLFEQGTFNESLVDNPISKNHSQSGQNVLFLDGHCKWTSASNAGVDSDNIFLAGNLKQYTGTESPVSKCDSFLLPAWSGK